MVEEQRTLPEPPEPTAFEAEDGTNGRKNRAPRPGRSLRRLEVRPGSRAGNRRVRIVRPFADEFRTEGQDYLVATERAGAPARGFGAFVTGFRRFLIGRPIASEREESERVSKLKALAILASDN